MRKPSLIAPLFIAASLLVSACGFHLPDEVATADAIPQLKVTGDWHNSFFRKTVDLLRMRGVKVYTNGYGTDGIDKNDKKIPTLSVPGPSVSAPLMSVNAYMSALEYSLIVRTSNILSIPGHRPILMRNALTRTYLNKSGKALATSNEFQEMVGETYDELATQLVNRIAYLGRQSDPDASPLTPAILTESKDDPSSKVSIEELPEGTTLMDALRIQNEIESANAKEATPLSKLNNGSAILNSQEDRDNLYLNRSYSLPKVKPTLKGAAPDIDESNF